jgi:hypothetical protein
MIPAMCTGHPPGRGRQRILSSASLALLMSSRRNAQAVAQTTTSRKSLLELANSTQCDSRSCRVCVTHQRATGSGSCPRHHFGVADELAQQEL